MHNTSSNSSSSGGQSAQQNKENIQVFLRMRPLNPREMQEEQGHTPWRIQDNSIMMDSNAISMNSMSINSGKLFSYSSSTYTNLMSGNHSKAYSFSNYTFIFIDYLDKCFDQDFNNHQVYLQSCRDIVLSSLEGINGTIFMYGQTGAGKTFTMLGEQYQQEIKELAQQQIGSGFLKRANSARGSAVGIKTPNKGGSISTTFQPGQGLTLSMLNQEQSSNVPAHISPISSHKAIQNVTPVCKATLLVGSTNQGSVSKFQGSIICNSSGKPIQGPQSSTPRHQKNVSSNGRSALNGKLPLPLYKQNSQGAKTRNHASVHSQSLFNASNLLQHSGSQVDFSQSVVCTSFQNQEANQHKQSLSLDPKALESCAYQNYVETQCIQDGINMRPLPQSARNLTAQYNDQFNEASLQGTEGILIQSLKELFNKIRTQYQSQSNSESQTTSEGSVTPQATKIYIIRCSYFEIYNDAVYDLLCENGEQSFHEPLQLHEDIKKKEFVVRGLREHVVESLDDCLALLRMGEVNRHYAQTKMNHQSSRSHTLFRLHVESMACGGNSQASEGGIENVITESILNFVDLAGSEKISIHGVPEAPSSFHGALSQTRDQSNMRVKEGQHINKSLFFLTQVIALKAEGKKNEQHIPYRNSPLTKILRSSLGGNSRTAIILCATPSASQMEQTFSTLRFGQNAKMIQNKVVANVVKKTSMEDEAELKAIMSEYERRLNEMEKDSQKNNDKLKQVIESLMKEKDELNQRLINANNRKLQALVLKETQQQEAKQQVQHQQPEIEKVQSFYLWNCGIVHSYSNIETYTQKRNVMTNDKLHQVEYIVNLNDKLDQQNCKVFMNSLRMAKSENQELRQVIDELQQQNNQLNYDKEELVQSLQQAKGEQYMIQETHNSEKERFRQESERLQSNIALISNEFDILKEKYQELLETRYQVSQTLLTQLNEVRLNEIENLLFQGIQKINQEKGKRQFMQMMQQQQVQHQSSRQDMTNLQVSTTQHQDKSTFLVVEDTEDDFMGKTFQRRLDFDGVEISSTLHRDSENDFKSKYNVFYHNEESQSESIIVHSQAATCRKQQRRSDISDSCNGDDSYQCQIVSKNDFIDSNDISQITAINTQQVAPQQTLTKEPVHDKIQELQQQINNLKIEKENSLDKTPSKSSIIFAQSKSYYLKTPNSSNTNQNHLGSMQKFTLDNDFNQSLRQIISNNPGSQTTRAGASVPANLSKPQDQPVEKNEMIDSQTIAQQYFGSLIIQGQKNQGRNQAMKQHYTYNQRFVVTVQNQQQSFGPIQQPKKANMSKYLSKESTASFVEDLAKRVSVDPSTANSMPMKQGNYRLL